MKILFDENLDPRLKEKIVIPDLEISVFTVKDMKWLGMKNGELLNKTNEEGFDVFISGDRKIIFQQNLYKYNFKVVILKLLKNNYQNQIEKVISLNKMIIKIHNKELIEKYIEL